MALEYRSGHYNVIYYPTGRYGKKVRLVVPESIQDPGEAQAWHDAEHVGPLTGLSIGELWEEYLKSYSSMHHAETTQKDLKGISKWVKRYIGQFDAESVSLHHLAIYQRMRMKESVKRVGEKTVPKPIPRAVNKEVAYLGGMIRWAGKQGHITPRKLTPDALPYDRPLPKILTAEEVIALLRVVDPFHRAYLLCLYAMGLRSIEARNLKWRDVNFERGTVQMVQKGGSTKSLPMGAAVVAALKEIVPPEAKREDGWEGRPVFENKKAKQGKAVQDLRWTIRTAVKRAEITKRVTPHLFRHSFATHLVDENVSIGVVQHVLGHKDIQTTQIYTHTSLENLRQAQNLIGGKLDGLGYKKGAKILKWDTGKKGKPAP
jgi:integrase/recombinase XerC